MVGHIQIVTVRLRIALILLAAPLLLAAGCSTVANEETQASVPTTSVPTTEATDPTTTDSSVLTSVQACESQLEEGVELEEGSFDGIERTWQLAVPANEISGVIFDLHGTGGTIAVHDAITRLSVEGPKRGYVVVTPQGLENPTRWTVPGIPGPDDVSFVTSLLEDVRERGCVDAPAFATGKSSGAAMTTQLACKTDQFRAIAPVAGISLIRRCPEGSALSVLAYHGTADAWVPFVGPEGWEETEAEAGSFFVGDPAATGEAFVERSECSTEATTSNLGEETTMVEWSCPNGHRVVFYKIDGGGHTHPGQVALDIYAEFGSNDAVGPTSITFDGTDVMLDFFDRSLSAS